VLDINFVRENKKIVEKAVKDKNLSENVEVDKLLKLDEKRRKYISESEKLRARRNEIANALKSGIDKELMKEGKEVKKKVKKSEEKLRKTESEFREMMLWTPTIPEKNVPVGKDESGNVEVLKWGKPRKFDSNMQDHIELGKSLDLIDIERGVKVSGFRGYFLKNEAVLMQMGLMWLGMQEMIKRGFTPTIPPTVVKEFTLTGTGYFPFGEGDNYEISNVNEEKSGKLMKEKIYLAGTAEVGLGGYYANEVIQEKDLPVKFGGFSPCFRREVGSYGKDTHGIYRIHEFMKIEQFIVCRNDYQESMKYFEELREISEAMLQALELPYRVIEMCTGDMGAGKYKMYDIETWMPSRKSYGETHSNSNLGEWQARRLNIKYKTKGGGTKYVHTLNNTAIASPRILIAILEGNQNEDGSVKVPKVLQEFVGKEVIVPR